MHNGNQLYPFSISCLFPNDAVSEWMKNGTELTFSKGDEIMKPSNMKNSVYLIKEGKAQIYHLHGDGKECVVGVLSRGDFIHMMDIFTDNETEMVAKALVDIKVSVVGKKEIREIVMKSPDLALKLLGEFSFKLHEMIEILSQVAYGKVEERLLFMFRKLADKDLEVDGWTPIPVSLTHQDIAGMVASTRETVTVLMNKLIQRGLVKKLDNNIWIRLEQFTSM